MDASQPSLDLFNESRAYIKGKVIHEIFHNPDTLYSVSRVRIIETTETLSEKEMVVVGVYPSLMEDEVYTFWGQQKEHPKFGLQYQVQQYRKEIPQGKDGIVQYLSSDLFPGIGRKIAQRVVQTLGEQAISRLLENPTILAEVPQLSEKKRSVIIERLMEYQGLEQIMAKLSHFGIGVALSVQIYHEYGQESLSVLQDNPYQLIEDIEGIGFKRADAIGEAMGIATRSPERVSAACIYYLREQTEQQGHVYLPIEDFLCGVHDWLNQASRKEEAIIDERYISEQVIELGKQEKLFIEEDRAYLPSLFYAEKGFAKKISTLLDHQEHISISQQDFLRALGQLEEELGIEYAETQKQAIETAIASAIMILTGGPGTGKTTVIQGICEIYADLHGLSLEPKDYVNKEESFPILLVAPTGRAAKRMTESTGIPAVTIHRLLGWKGGKAFEHDEEQPIQGKLIIIDESSMMDQWLANQLFRSLPDDIQVVIVGDQNQLPSVGPGQVLRDLIDSERIPKVELKDIYRQAQGSSIISLAHDIKDGKFLTDIAEDKQDRRFFPCSPSQTLDAIKKICTSAIRKGYTQKDIQVLAPMYRGEAGIDAINECLQQEFNQKSEQKRELKNGEQIFRVGDKVLQLSNNPEQNVFNGDMGEVVSIIYAKENTDHEDQLVVAFDQNEVIYKRADFKQITLAYCCSVHKSQGSEFSIVVLPVLKRYSRMLKRNLIYTAVTRAKDYLIMCGEQEALDEGIKRQDDATRYTSLKDTLQEWIPQGLESNESMN